MLKTHKKDLNIRLAKQEDFTVVVELIGKLLTELGDKPLEASSVEICYEEVIGDKHGSFIVLGEYDNLYVGVCSVSIIPSLRARGIYGVIQEMYISETYRSQGFGQPLLNYSLRHARALGCRFIELGTPLPGDRQNNFYGQSGFKVVGDRLRYYLE